MSSRTDYPSLLAEHGHSPEAVRMSAAGQRFRFEKLLEIGELDERRVLDLGCGCGHFFPVLNGRFPRASYVGMDVAGDLVAAAAAAYPDGRFVERDVLREGLEERYDYVLMSALFNDPEPDAWEFLCSMLEVAFAHAEVAIGFNFISTHVNTVDDDLAYHDPVRVLDFVLRALSRRVSIQHHYERCDVAVFAYR
jgi:SAM-dependent methyltransferase